MKEKIHFVGIGGIGVSGLASIFLDQGLQVQGSDLAESELTKQLERRGIKVFIGHRAENLGSADRVIYSPAIPPENPELNRAKQLGLKCQSYPEAVGQLLEDYTSIAIAGTHGKSTTASMIAKILEQAGLDPSFIIGTKPGFRVGKSQYFIIEADEYKRSFLNYRPDFLVITNIEADHLDYFKDLDEIKTVFLELRLQSKKVITWQQEAIELEVPGQHNQQNASAALAVARELGVDEALARQALLNFKGVWRRFEYKGRVNKAIVIDDYAHHPTEVAATLQATKQKYPDKEILAVFQAHQYQRLEKLFDDFVDSFTEADQVIITDVFEVAGRDQNVKKTGQDLARAIGDAQFVPIKRLAVYLKKIAQPDQVILMLGAGDIYKVTEAVLD